jgi:hypothetical protein
MGQSTLNRGPRSGRPATMRLTPAHHHLAIPEESRSEALRIYSASGALPYVRARQSRPPAVAAPMTGSNPESSSQLSSKVRAPFGLEDGGKRHRGGQDLSWDHLSLSPGFFLRVHPRGRGESLFAPVCGRGHRGNFCPECGAREFTTDLESLRMQRSINTA